MSRLDDCRDDLRTRERARLWRRGSLRLVSGNGTALAGQRVRLQQVNSPFRIGSCLGRSLLSPDASGELMRSTVRAHFNTAVCENAMKWYATEAEADRETWADGDALLDWCAAENLPLRGHCLFWDKLKFAQTWIQQLSPEALRDRMRRHLDGVQRWRGRLSCWDACNELLDGGFHRERLGDDGPAWIFREAHARDAATPLFVNEYGILDSDEKTGRYLDLIADLQQRGAPVGGIGIQEHAAERFVPDLATAEAEADRPERQGRGPLIIDGVRERLDRLAATGLPIHLTEISIKTLDRARAADCLELLLRSARAHPAVAEVLFWGFLGRSHWLGESAALMDARGRVYPALARLAELQREWSSSIETTSDADGVIAVEGWIGSYTLSIDHTVTSTWQFDGGNAEQVVSPKG